VLKTLVNIINKIYNFKQNIIYFSYNYKRGAIMKEITTLQISEAVNKLCIEANYYLSEDMRRRLKEAYSSETWGIAKDLIKKIIENADIAKNESVPMCQDTGMACVFVEVGQDVHIVGGSIEDAINEGVRKGYDEGFLRKSIVKDPIDRVNTKDNTPAIITYNIVPGDKLKIVVAPKGFGSENMSQLKMLKPSDGIEGVKRFILQVVEEAGPNPCPPIVVGVGIGGNFDKAAALAKKALIRSTDVRNSNPYYSELEKEMLQKINSLGIGPQGFGGRNTALAVNIETYPTHIAGLPVAVNINCHATRHAEIEL
jgi:fumarate hydratase subunit alpha